MWRISRIAPNERKPREAVPVYVLDEFGRACHRTIRGRGVVGRLIDQNGKKMRKGLKSE